MPAHFYKKDKCTGGGSASRWVLHWELGRCQSLAHIWSPSLPLHIAAAILGRAAIVAPETLENGDESGIAELLQNISTIWHGLGTVESKAYSSAGLYKSTTETTANGLLRPFSKCRLPTFVSFTRENIDQWADLHSTVNNFLTTFKLRPAAKLLLVQKRAVLWQGTPPRQANASLQRYYLGGLYLWSLVPPLFLKVYNFTL